MKRNYTVYYGKINGKIVYVGTTIQRPADRFRWHKYNGKDFEFEVVKTFDNSEEMLEFEFSEIKRLNPVHNKITGRRQNFNAKLAEKELEMRKTSKEWCQSCLRRRVNTGYKKCRFC
jgi:hypothetical protein